MASTRLGYLAVKREATVADAVTPDKFLRFKDGDVSYNQEIIANNPIQNMRWNAIQAVPGQVTTEGTYNVDLDANEGVHWLAACIGSVSSSDISSAGDSSVFKHTITLANSLPSLTLEQGKGNLNDTSNNRQNYQVDRAYGVLIDSISMSGENSIINMEVSLKAHGVFQKSNLVSDASSGSSVAIDVNSVEGLTTSDTINIYDTTPQNETQDISSIDTVNKTVTVSTLSNSYTVSNDGKIELVPQTPSYGTDPQVLSFTHASFQFGSDLTDAGSNNEENIENWSLEFSNNLEERFGSLRSSPSVIAPKGANATLSYTKYFENVEDRDRYLDQTKKAGILTITNNKVVSGTDTNQAKYTVKVLMSDVRFTSYNMPTGTDELYAAEIEAQCFYDSTDGRAIQLEVTNEKTGTEYTA